MPHTIPACPQCGQENTYPDGSNYVCPDCALEWPQVADAAETDAAEAGDGVVRDANGNPLADGDAVILVKDLKVSMKNADEVVDVFRNALKRYPRRATKPGLPDGGPKA